MNKSCSICLLLLAFIYVVLSQECKSSFVIKDDPELDKIIAQVREQFLATRPTPVTRLNVALLIPNEDGTWRQGTFNPNDVQYPASCVKLTYLLAAMKWCNDRGLPPTCLDFCTHPMIMNSDNLATGIVVDIITGAPNIRNLTVDNDEFQEWVKKRSYTKNYLDELGLLGNQTILSKTYPTNSGQSPSGAEGLAREMYGSNAMSAQCAAYLMLEIMEGKVQPQATEYMSQLLIHHRWYPYTTFGFGLPPGTIMHNKIGNAYNTLQEISYIILPNGVKFILAAFSDGYEPNFPSPWDCSNLGVFAELLVNATGLGAGNPPIIILDNADAQLNGAWKTRSDLPDKYGSSFATSNDKNATAVWNVNLELGGLYEVAVWSPQSSDFSKSTTVVINSEDGPQSFSLNQRILGGRWIYLGDFQFAQGMNNGLASIIGNSETAVANAIKLSRWPYCNNVPGAIC